MVFARFAYGGRKMQTTIQSLPCTLLKRIHSFYFQVIEAITNKGGFDNDDI